MSLHHKPWFLAGLVALCSAWSASAQDIPVGVNPSMIQITSDGGVIVFQNDDGSTTKTLMPSAVPRSGNISSGGIQGKFPNGAGNVSNGVIQSTTIEQMRQRALDSLQQALGCSDPEWAVVLPKLEKIQMLASAAGEPMAMIGPVAKQTSSGTASNVSIARQALHQALQNPYASEQEIKQKTEALRQARAKARDELAIARKDLVEILTQRQEAILIDRRILE